jgi:hypothetical protein
MIQDISKYIQDLVNQIDPTIEGVYNVSTEVTDTCNTKWARVGKLVKDEALNEAFITEISTDEYIKAGTLDGLITLPTPYFISGTRTATNREWTISNPDVTEKTPIIWLLHDVRIFKYGRESVLDWDSDLRIFFLDETDPTNYYTHDHVKNVVVPMSKLADEFIKVVNYNRIYKTLESYEIINFTRFGVEEQSGYFQNILDANLSGVELRITLTKYKENCKNC